MEQASLVARVDADRVKHASVEQSVQLRGGDLREEQLEHLQDRSTVERTREAYPPISGDIDSTCVVMASHHFSSESSQSSANCFR